MKTSVRLVAILIGLLLFGQSIAQASHVTGTIKLGNGTPLGNSTLTFNLNQSGVVVGSFAVATDQVTCGTSVDGAVVGITNPLAAPVTSASTLSGSVPAGSYYVRVAYWVDEMVDKVTLVSPARLTTLTGSGRITVQAPALQPTGATGYKVYMSTTSGAEKLQATVTGWGSVTITSLLTVTAVPSTNTTLCDLTFNDTIIPSYTWYRVGAVASNASTVSGFPMNWYLAGASVDVSTQYPLASVNQQTRFPTPLLANPSSNALQSVASPVTLNGYPLTAGAILLPANASPPACTGTTSLIYTDNATGEIQFCQNGATVTGILDWHDSDTDSVIGNQFLGRSFARANPTTGKFLQMLYDGNDDKAYIISHQYGGTDEDEALDLIGSVVTIHASDEFGILAGDVTLDATGAVSLVGTNFSTNFSGTGSLAITGNTTVTLGGTLTSTVAGVISVTGNGATFDLIANDLRLQADVMGTDIEIKDDATINIETDDITIAGATTVTIDAPTVSMTNATITDGATVGSISVRKKVYLFPADGAIALHDGIQNLTQNSMGAYTVANPTADQVGTIMYIVATFAQPHVVVFASDLYGTMTDTATWDGMQGSFLEVLAIDGHWLVLNKVGVALT